MILSTRRVRSCLYSSKDVFTHKRFSKKKWDRLFGKGDATIKDSSRVSIPWFGHKKNLGLIEFLNST